MPITDWPLQERPRERLLHSGAQSLSNAELLAIFLRTGVKGKTALDVARDLITTFGSLGALLTASRTELCQHPGLGDAKYVLLQAALELSQRWLYEHVKSSQPLTCSQQTKHYLASQLRHRKREVFACLFLDTRNQVLCFEELFYGTIDSASVHPREIVKRALQLNAANVILAHNHPSGIATPSLEDKNITQQLTNALALVDIQVLDHMIIGGSQVVSFAELGLL